MTKICFVCKCKKDISEFYKHSAMKDGYLNKCKDCCRKQATERRNQNIDKVREYDRNRPNKAERKRWNKEYKSKMREENPEKYDKIFHGARKHYRAKHKEKVWAQGKLDDAIRYGKIIRPNACSVCGIECKPQAHHYDYSKPLDVVWVCAKCHAEIHKKMREETRSKAKFMEKVA